MQRGVAGILRVMNDAPRAIDIWLDTPLGRYVRTAERVVATRVLERVFGVQTIQIGQWGGSEEFLTLSQTQRAALVSNHRGPGVSVRSRPSALGIATDSVDAVILPHTLELDPDPHEVLREVARVLCGEGHVLVFGFNPMSLWGLRRLLTGRWFPPEFMHFLPERRLRDWLSLLGFDILEVRGYCFGAPVRRLSVVPRPSVSKLSGDHFWPLLAGAYMMLARKRVYRLVATGAPWRNSRRVVGGLVEPTTRTLL